MANCRACVDACPTGAWIFDDEALGLDTELCDGCGLCVGVCPVDALEAPTVATLAREQPQRAVLDLACERSETGGLPAVACLHATSPRELAELYSRGLRELEVCDAPCADCSRAGKRPSLEASLADLDRVLTATGQPPLRMAVRSPAAWYRSASARRRRDGTPDLGRRGLFRRILPASVEERHGGDGADEALASLVAKIPPGEPRPHVPRIDPSRCVACHACAQLCPTGAIYLERQSVGARYLLRPELCTACGLCVDACEHDAVEVGRWAPWQQVVLDLVADRCRACGVEFHTPAQPGGNAVEAGKSLCRICVLKRPTKNLYQVLP